MSDNKKIVELVKDTMRNGMIENYKKDGCLVPVLYFYDTGSNELYISNIENDYLSTQSGKELLSEMIKGICKIPTVIVAGVIIEAYASNICELDEDTLHKYNNGQIKTSELKNKIDIIVMVLSTPQSEELICYKVNSNTREVEEYIDDSNNFSGLFSNFFKWNKN